MKIEPNNIYQGNCYELIKQIPDKSIDLIYTDIPYNISYSGAGVFKTKIKNALFKEQMHDEQLVDGIDYSILDEFCRVLKNIYIYIWCSKNQVIELLEYFKDKCNYNILVWCKTNPVPFGASNFLSDIEYCLVFYEKGTKFNDGFQHKSKWYISSLNQNDKKSYKHPTIKPLQLVERHITNSTSENDIILDPFVGSGTTCVACKNLNRKYIGFEINEEYFKIAQDRLNGIDQKGQIRLFE